MTTPSTSPRLRSLALAGGALVAAACSRDLALPQRSTLSLADPFPSAAPYEQLTLAPAGGAPPYRFAFAPGGNSSSGTIDAGTGVYTAGPAGPAIDLVTCSDAAGATVQARIGVGSPLQVSTTSAFIAPGGRASFIPSGGKAPYLLAVVGGPAPGTIVGTAFEASPSGGCNGAVSPPATVALRLSDATAAPPIDLTVTVGRGLDLFPAAGTGAVAPHEQIAFVASGGQPPYSFSLAIDASFGATVEVGRGTYVAGPKGNAVDVVRVTDAILQERCFSVGVGPELAVTLTPSDARPGKTMRLVATGGRPPYTFSFAPRGNRSRATLDDVSGAYVPGRNALATDLLMVSDATAAPPIGPIAVTVGPVEVVTGDGNYGCWAAPVNGDTLPDVLLAGYYGSVKTVLMSKVGDLPAVAEYPMTLTAQPVALDLDRDGDTDLAYLDGAGQLRTLLAQPGGALLEGPRADVGSSAVGVSPAAGTTGRIFVTTTYHPVCNPTSGQNSIVGFDYDTVTRAFKAAVCVTPPIPWRLTGLAAGDFDGDGIDDVAYGATANFGMMIFWRASRDGYVEHSLTLPAPWRAWHFNSQQVSPWLAVRPSGAPYADLAVVVIDAPAGGAFNTGIAVLSGSATGLTLKQVRPTVPGGYNIMSVSPIGMGPGGRPQLVAANVTNGTVEVLDYLRTSSTPLSLAAVQLPERSFRVGSVCAGDFDGDGIQDLFVAPRNGYGASGEVLLGEGDGTYAVRPRFALSSGLSLAGDVDGDGATDFLEPTPGGGLQILFSTQGELALGPETAIDGQFLAAAVSDWNYDGVPDLVVRAGAEGVQLLQGLPARDGRFAPALPVATTDPYGAPTTYAAAFLLGGHFQPKPASGPRPLDLLGIERVGSVFREVVLLFVDATHAIVAYPPGTGYYQPLAFDADGDGVDDLADVDYAVGIKLSLVKPGSAPGPNWPFQPWATVSTRYPDLSAGVVPVPNTSRARGVFVGAYGFTLVEAPNGVAGAVEIPIDPSLLTTVAANYTYDARVALVDGDGYPDLVVARPPPDSWLVFRGTSNGTFSATPTLALGFQPGFATLSPGYSILPVRGPTGQDDLVVNAAPGTVVVLHNDGTGHYR